MTDLQFIPFAKTDEIEENRVNCFKVENIYIVVGKVADEYFAVENKCSHSDATFASGRIREYKLLCPLHGAIFDIRDGSVLSQPAYRPIKSYPVKVDGDQLLICLEQAE